MRVDALRWTAWAETTVRRTPRHWRQGLGASLPVAAGACLAQVRLVRPRAGWVHKALRDAVRLRLISHNPAAEVEKPRPEKPKMQVYDAAQTQALLAAASGDRLYALFVLALDTGMRQGELFALEWGDIDFEAGSVLVQRSQINGRHRVKEPKSGKGRRIDLSPFAVETLQEHRKTMLAEGSYRPDGPVFCAPEGGWLHKPNFQRRVFRPLQKAAKLPAIRFHDLRHNAESRIMLTDQSGQ